MSKQKITHVYKENGEYKFKVKQVNIPRSEKILSIDSLLSQINKDGEFSSKDISIITAAFADISDNTIIVTKEVKQTYKFYTLLSMVFLTMIVLSNIGSSKLAEIFGFVITGGMLPFILTYTTSDVINEVYGYKNARLMIWSGTFCNLLLIVGLEIIVWQPPSSYWHNQYAFALVLQSVPRIVLASVSSYIIGEFINLFVYSKLKLKSSKTYIYRYIISGCIGVLTDTCIFVIIAYYGVMPTSNLFLLSSKICIVKFVGQIMLLPLFIKLCNYLKIKEGVDIIDNNTNFNPFSLDIHYSIQNNQKINQER